MLTIYENRSGALERQKGKPRITEEAVWVDLLNPTPEEEQKIERALKFDVPTRV
jgi:magnesium transporter